QQIIWQTIKNNSPIVLANPKCEVEYSNYKEAEVDLKINKYDSSNSNVE
ncbi:10814_t:CDS:1, partial [Dentiscutata erythropus]